MRKPKLLDKLLRAGIWRRRSAPSRRPRRLEAADLGTELGLEHWLSECAVAPVNADRLAAEARSPAIRDAR